MEVCFYMTTNSLKLSYKNESLLYKIFMKLMAPSHSPMRLIYTSIIIEDWMGLNPNAHISNFTFFGMKSQKSGFFINLGRFKLNTHP